MFSTEIILVKVILFIFNVPVSQSSDYDWTRFSDSLYKFHDESENDYDEKESICVLYNETINQQLLIEYSL